MQASPGCSPNPIHLPARRLTQTKQQIQTIRQLLNRLLSGMPLYWRLVILQGSLPACCNVRPDNQLWPNRKTWIYIVVVGQTENQPKPVFLSFSTIQCQCFFLLWPNLISDSLKLQFGCKGPGVKMILHSTTKEYRGITNPLLLFAILLREYRLITMSWC